MRPESNVTINVTDRYRAAGIPYPDPKTMCKGQCEGMGVVPIGRDEQDPRWKALWDEAEADSPSDDGWHFVTCPECGGTGKDKAMTPEIKMPDLSNIPAPEGTWDEWEPNLSPCTGWYRQGDVRAIHLTLYARRKRRPTVEGWLLRNDLRADVNPMDLRFEADVPFKISGTWTKRLWSRATRELIPVEYWPASGGCKRYTLEVDAVAGGPDEKAT